MLVSCVLTSEQNENRMDANSVAKVKNGTCPFLAPPELYVSDLSSASLTGTVLVTGSAVPMDATKSARLLQ